LDRAGRQFEQALDQNRSCQPSGVEYGGIGDAHHAQSLGRDVLWPHAQSDHQGKGRPGSLHGGRGRGQVVQASKRTLSGGWRIVEKARE